jgi:ribonuclease D
LPTLPAPRKSLQPRQIELPEKSRQGSVPLIIGDVSKAVVKAARESGVVAWDIETSGLDWRSERIGLCQLWIADHDLTIVKTRRNKIPENLVAILQDGNIQKIFHHAMFDLRFLSYHWNIEAQNIACTKIASKLLDPQQSEGHTLAALLQRYLGVTLDKTKRMSDWLSWDLSDDQLIYAGNDVVHLPQLLNRLMQELVARNASDLALKCFAHIPTQVRLDVRGYKDVFGY